MSKIIVNNVELNLNLLDADVMEKFERLNDEIRAKIQDPKNYAGKSNADGMRYQCRCIEEFFDNLFGEGASGRVFAGAGKNDLGIRMECFGQVMGITSEARTEVQQISGKYVQRYMNREQRRAEQHNGGYNGGKNKGNKYNFPRDRG